MLNSRSLLSGSMQLSQRMLPLQVIKEGFVFNLLFLSSTFRTVALLTIMNRNFIISERFCKIKLFYNRESQVTK